MKKAIVGIIGGIATVAIAAPACASVAISGVCYSDGTTFYSSNVRTMTSTRTIQANFNSLPKLGLYFGTMTQTHSSFGHNSWKQSETDITRNVSSSSVSKGTKFINYFKLPSACDDWKGCKPYTFDGNESY